MAGPARVAVAVDSSACLPARLAAEWDVGVVPLQVTVGGRAGVEGAGGDAGGGADKAVGPADVVAALRAGETVTTSQPSVAALQGLVGEAAVVLVAISGELSGTVSSARAVTADGAALRVVDSRTVALGAGVAALSAAAVARAGGSVEDVAAEAERVAASAACAFTVDSLEYLRRGGRVGAAAAAIGDALGVRPVLAVADGAIEAVARVRSTAKAREAVLERIVAHARGLERPVVGIATLPGDEAAAVAAAEFVRAHLGCAVVMAPLSAVLAAHAGPGALAVTVADAHAEVAAALR